LVQVVRALQHRLQETTELLAATPYLVPLPLMAVDMAALLLAQHITQVVLVAQVVVGVLDLVTAVQAQAALAILLARLRRKAAMVAQE